MVIYYTGLWNTLFWLVSCRIQWFNISNIEFLRQSQSYKTFLQLQFHIKESPAICSLSVDFLAWGFDRQDKFGVNAFWSKPVWIMNEKRSICPSRQDKTTTPRLPWWMSWKNQWESSLWHALEKRLKERTSHPFNKITPSLPGESFACDRCQGNI